MKLPKTPPSELIADLKELARASFVETFPNIAEDETIEADAAQMITEMVADFRKIAGGDAESVEIAKRWLEDDDITDQG